jgi:hypothetical protein
MSGMGANPLTRCWAGRRPETAATGNRSPDCSVVFPEHCLYELLARSDSDTAHGRYNAPIRRLVSFERAAECARR